MKNSSPQTLQSYFLSWNQFLIKRKMLYLIFVVVFSDSYFGDFKISFIIFVKRLTSTWTSVSTNIKQCAMVWNLHLSLFLCVYCNVIRNIFQYCAIYVNCRSVKHDAFIIHNNAYCSLLQWNHNYMQS